MFYFEHVYMYSEVGELEQSSNPIPKTFVREFSSTTSPSTTPKRDQDVERSISLSLMKYDGKIIMD